MRENSAIPKVPRVVIVGGGFGGFYAARALAKAPVQVTLVDKRNYHLFRPMLYQVATGLISGDEIAPPLRVLFSRQKNIDVLMSEVTGVDTRNRRVLLPDCDLPYDYLILATGIQVNYFGHEEWKRIAPGLEALEDADKIRSRILTAFEEAEQLALCGDADPVALKELLTFVLVGGGTVGVELAGTIAEMAKMALAHDFRHLGPGAAQVMLYEGTPRILPSFAEDLSAKATRHLEELGVKVFTGTRVESVDAEGIVADGKRIRSRTVMWTAGVAASPAARWLGAEADKAGRVKVNPDLSVPGHAEIFVIGDTALVIANTRNLLGFKSGTRVQMPGAGTACHSTRRVCGGADSPPHHGPGWTGALLVAGTRATWPWWGVRSPSAICGFGSLPGPRLGCVGRRPPLFSYWIYQSALRHAALDGAVCHQAPWSRGGGCANAGCRPEAG